MSVKLNDRYLREFVGADEVSTLAPFVGTALELLEGGKGAGSEFTGWLNLPREFISGIYAAERLRVIAAAERIRKQSKVLFVIGIGGSYLGARAVLELLKGSLYNNTAAVGDGVEIYFAGNSLSSSYLNELLEIADKKDFSVNVVSKSGTTTEPAVAFRVFSELLVRKYGEAGAKERIYATTDKARGTLKTLSDEKGYETFTVPDDVGGRFSVLTAVGLLPLAVAGVDIDKLLLGADTAAAALRERDVVKNDMCRYAALRNILYRKGRAVEMFVGYENSFVLFGEWLKQLFGESEGKAGKGLFPSAATFSTDLHSLGQYLQDGANIIFETVVKFKEAGKDYFLPKDGENRDGLNFLADRPISEVKEQAFLGTVLAHTDGGTPNIVLEVDRIDEENVGYLIYFFEKACAVSGYLLGVNPFDQPGVEGYKNNMFALLGKAGYEAAATELRGKLAAL